MTARLIVPIPPSVNHFLGIRRGRVFKTAPAIRWEKEALILGQHWRQQTHWNPTVGKKIIADWWVWWPDAGVHDPNNLEKVLWDAFEGIVYDDDRWVLPRCQNFELDTQNPRVEVEFRVKEES